MFLRGTYTKVCLGNAYVAVQLIHILYYMLSTYVDAYMSTLYELQNP